MCTLLRNVKIRNHSAGRLPLVDVLRIHICMERGFAGRIRPGVVDGLTDGLAAYPLLLMEVFHFVFGPGSVVEFVVTTHEDGSDRTCFASLFENSILDQAVRWSYRGGRGGDGGRFASFVRICILHQEILQ